LFEAFCRGSWTPREKSAKVSGNLALNALIFADFSRGGYQHFQVPSTNGNGH
jgi:hypothetical protein